MKIKNLFKNTKKGFTLVEMLVVVAIIGILSTSIYIGYSKYVENSKIIILLCNILLNRELSRSFFTHKKKKLSSEEKSIAISFKTFIKASGLFTLMSTIEWSKVPLSCLTIFPLFM